MSKAQELLEKVTEASREEAKFEQTLYELLLEDDGGLGIRKVQDFKEAGMMSDNAGLVVTLNNGKEYQLTIIER